MFNKQIRDIIVFIYKKLLCLNYSRFEFIFAKRKLFFILFLSPMYSIYLLKIKLNENIQALVYVYIICLC